MVELAIQMTDAQVEQIEKTTHLGKEIILLPPDVARGFGRGLERMFGEPLLEIGVILENSQSSQLETNQALRNLIADMKSSHATTRKTIDGLRRAEKAQIRLSKDKSRFEFSGRFFEEYPEQEIVVIEGEELKQILGALEYGMWQNLSVLAGNAETLSRISRIKGVREDSQVIHRIVNPLLEIPEQFRNLERIKVITDDEGNSKFDLIPNKERVVIG